MSNPRRTSTEPSLGGQIPSELLPQDGRFGCGPSKVRAEALNALVEIAPAYLGTSHRQATVRTQVGRLRGVLRELFSLPDDYEVVLGNGGATAFWDVALFSLWDEDTRAQFLSFGEFGGKFATAAKSAAGSKRVQILTSEAGSAPRFAPDPAVDVYATPQCETSTGVTLPISRPVGGRDDALFLVDATSAAGGVLVDVAETDAYFFSPQKCFGSEGGLWVAFLSPAALVRMEGVRASNRHIPAFLDLSLAVENSRKDQTYNTPALSTIFLAAQQAEWFLEQGGLEWCDTRCRESSEIVYHWAEKSPVATPFVEDPALRSSTVVTVDFDSDVDAAAIASSLRAAGVVDVEPYRKLGRNQLRIATFPAIEPADLAALVRCIDFLVEAI